MMATIDALKDQMSDAVYLELCNKMKELHNQEEDKDETKKPYCIWFFEAKGWTVHLGEIYDGDRYDTDGRVYSCDEIGRTTTELHRYDLFVKKQIVMMSRSQARSIQRVIKQQDRHCCEFSFDRPTMSRFYDDPMVGQYKKMDDHTVLVYHIEPM